MKTILKALFFLAIILGFGWLIFDFGGRPGDIALGFLLGAVAALTAGLIAHAHLTKGKAP